MPPPPLPTANLPKMPRSICTEEGQQAYMCNEAAIIHAAHVEFCQATRQHFSTGNIEEWSEWGAEGALQDFMSRKSADQELGAAALVAFLMLSKYSRLSPLSHGRLAALYSVYHYRKGCKPWWAERNDAHLLMFSAYIDIIPFGSPDHDGIETLQAALGFDVHSKAGIAMQCVALAAGRPRNVAAVFGRLLRLLPRRSRLHLDASGDWFETLLAMAAGWIEPSTNAHMLHQQWLAGVFPTDRVGVLQLARTVSGHQKSASRDEESGRWQYSILAARLGQLVSIQGRRSLLELERVATLPKETQLAATQVTHTHAHAHARARARAHARELESDGIPRWARLRAWA